MEKIPTAEEILNDRVYITQDGIEDVHDSISTVAEAMIEFAKLHVEQALKEAHKNVEMIADEEQDFRLQHCDCVDFVINKDSILNSYSLEKIK